MPSTEEGRRRIQQKLSQQRSLGGDQKGPDFFSKRKEAFLQKMVDMGMDLIEVQDFLDDKSIHEENPELVIDYYQNPHYVNPLKANFAQPVNPHARLQAQGYNYVPDQNGPARLMQQQSNLPLINAGGNGMMNPAQMVAGQRPKLLNPAGVEDEMCKVCMARQINTVMVPCGHRCLCE